MERCKLAIIIPAYNEDKTIDKLIKQVINFGVPIVIDDGSKDFTAEISLKAGAKVVSHKINMGYDEAINTGFRFACEYNFQYILTIDADGQHKSEYINEYINLLSKGTDCIVGIRKNRQRLAEYIVSFYGILFWEIDDPLCGMKAYNLDRYLGLKNSYIKKQIGMQFLIYAIKNNLIISQVNINENNRIDKPRFGSRFSSNYSILRTLLSIVFDDLLLLVKSTKKYLIRSNLFKKI